MNVRAGTAPPYRTSEPRRLAFWLALVALLAIAAYGARAASGKPDPQVLYRWSTAIGAVIQDGILVGLVLLIARRRSDLLALRAPESATRALRYLGTALVGVYVFEIAYTAITHPGNEQGLTPSHWEPHHAAAYIVNGVVICTVIPFAEELLYRGLGFSLLAPFGRWFAIVGVGIAFGLAHGLIVSLPVIVVFGSVLAWIRSRTGSVVPGMFVHATFNAIALVVAVTVGGS